MKIVSKPKHFDFLPVSEKVGNPDFPLYSDLCAFCAKKLRHGNWCLLANCLTPSFLPRNCDSAIVADRHDVPLSMTCLPACWKVIAVLVLLCGDSSEIKSLVK